MQFDLFATDAEITAGPAYSLPTGAGPAHVQGALFRPDARALRPPRRVRPAAPVALDPALHDGALI